ncbi:MAG: site-2 protease family protein [Candidatus Thorarchaeota archaeon]|nr:MAG: site-2 protease family protein [Candidatus Thorarchaeota archaeon]
MAFDDEPASVITYPTFAEINEILAGKFEIKMSVLEYGMPTFVVQWAEGFAPSNNEQEAVFDEIKKSTDSLKVWPLVRWRNEKEGEYIIRFVPKQQSTRSNNKINYVLFITTLASIALGGFLQASSPLFLALFYPAGYTIWDIAFTTIIFIAALMGIIFTHEMEHYKMSQRLGIEASLPYFLPGLPQIGGTFGAFISRKSHPMNRRDLIDMGLAGPIAGFAVTLVVLIIGFFMSVPVTAEQLIAIEHAFPSQSGSLAVPYLFVIMEYLFVDFIPTGGTIYLHPVAFAAWVGCLVTALNLFPVGQLDGGHALRSIVNPQRHKQIGWMGIIIMILLGYITMAILIIVMSSSGGHPGPLNDTVKVSNGRIALFLICMVILVLAIPPLGFMLF